MKKKKETVILYRVTSKRHVLEMTAKELCDNKEIISRFHPLDVRIIAYIAGFEHSIEFPHETRILDFEKLKKRIFVGKETL